MTKIFDLKLFGWYESQKKKLKNIFHSFQRSMIPKAFSLSSYWSLAVRKMKGEDIRVFATRMMLMST